ncbi:hypothetical protein [Paenibacillus pini]|uniref:hypothetical protein n=1 Tax=Paenibacillus pini TaxID=669461 RepID=UPI000B1426FD|nr:hypothetical protein [Paenibacillus pini]
MTTLLWITAIYMLAALLVHVFYRWHKRREERSKPDLDYVLVTSNHERQIEWYLRAFDIFALLSGKRLRITVFDDQSVDQTLDIVERMDHSASMELSVYTQPMTRGTEDATTLLYSHMGTVIDLRIPHEAGRIPYV